MVPLVQLVRASDCGSECHGFESHRAPQESRTNSSGLFFCTMGRDPRSGIKSFFWLNGKSSILIPNLAPTDSQEKFAIILDRCAPNIVFRVAPVIFFPELTTFSIPVRPIYGQFCRTASCASTFTLRPFLHSIAPCLRESIFSTEGSPTSVNPTKSARKTHKKTQKKKKA